MTMAGSPLVTNGTSLPAASRTCKLPTACSTVGAAGCDDSLRATISRAVARFSAAVNALSLARAVAARYFTTSVAQVAATAISAMPLTLTAPRRRLLLQTDGVGLREVVRFSFMAISLLHD